MAFRTNSIAKNLELMAKDNVGTPEGKSVVGAIRSISGTALAKVQRVFTRVGDMIIDLPSDTQYELVPREGALSETWNAVREIWHTRWFNGVLRPLNIVPKAIKTVTKGTDSLVRDGIQALGGGGKGDGYVLKPTGQS